MFKKSVMWAGAAVVALSLAGCGPHRPHWIQKGSGAFKDNGKVFYGVGMVEGIQSEALRRTTADNRAINEVAKQLSTVSTSLMRDYMSSASAPAEAKGHEDQYVENTVKTFASNVVSGVKITDRYQDPATGALYSLAELKLEDLKLLADQVQGLSNEVRDHIKANAESAFDKLADEEAKKAR